RSSCSTSSARATSSAPSPATRSGRWCVNPEVVTPRRESSSGALRSKTASRLNKGDAVMTTDEALFDAEERMEKALTVFKDSLRGLRTGRATPALLDALRVEYYGSPTPIKQLAQVSTPDPQQLVIRPFDAGALKDIEKAIRSSDLGLAPNSDGKVIRLSVPAMSGEQRQ